MIWLEFYFSKYGYMFKLDQTTKWFPVKPIDPVGPVQFQNIA